LKILVPHDGSAASDRALRKAISLGKRLNYEIILLHVIDLKLLQSDAILKYIQEKRPLIKAKTDLLKFLRMGGQSMLKRRIESSKKQGVKIRFSLGIGSTSEVIVNYAKTEKVDFIIMGSRGFPPLHSDKYQRLRILGSVARNVSELSDCPVMIVK
jgi:nucleotide-binding universal stress UspA family protein